ncbi:hypothetical protein CW751_08665 [Brumimicrobium salinarum]|uniref:Uncharacterized protein n=1 Tax=Brumimicrobium salinarum TaxID=2058658 RepID=A0A2I0R2P4_9FLAO|nr:hypothetical protein [Brumimicrobium salinarum]PKR80829.1 hypothetical protein CW751_08665 [Brumimicrobium salinarum]
MKKPIDQLKPEDAIPLFVKIKKLILGNKKPDGFTRLIFSFSLFAWFMLMSWNSISYFVLLTSDIIEKNKGFSVQEVIIKNGQKLGFNGEEFLASLHGFLFHNLFIWLLIFIGLALMYRKKRIYTLFVFGGLMIHFVYMFFTLGFQYFIEDISFFDKILYFILILGTLIHSFLISKEKETALKNSVSEPNEDSENL